MKCQFCDKILDKGDLGASTCQGCGDVFDQTQIVELRDHLNIEAYKPPEITVPVNKDDPLLPPESEQCGDCFADLMDADLEYCRDGSACPYCGASSPHSEEPSPSTTSDLSDTTNDTHQLAFSTNPNNSPAAAYTTGVTTTGTPGTTGAKVTINVAPVKKTGAPVLFYYCTAHAGMGNSIQTISPTSNEAEFNPQIDDIIEEAFERTGVQGTRTGYQLRSARRSLNIMFQEWANRGVHLWKIKLAKIPLVEGQAEYNFASDSENLKPSDIHTDIMLFWAEKLLSKKE